MNPGNSIVNRILRQFGHFGGRMATRGGTGRQLRPVWLMARLAAFSNSDWPERWRHRRSATGGRGSPDAGKWPARVPGLSSSALAVLADGRPGRYPSFRPPGGCRASRRGDKPRAGSAAAGSRQKSRVRRIRSPACSHRPAACRSARAAGCRQASPGLACRHRCGAQGQGLQPKHSSRKASCSAGGMPTRCMPSLMVFRMAGRRWASNLRSSAAALGREGPEQAVDGRRASLPGGLSRPCWWPVCSKT